MIKLPRNNIAVTPIYDPDKIGRIYVPDQAKERCDQGIVKYVGPEAQWLKTGDYVLFSGYTGTLVSIEDEGNLIIMPEDFVTAILTEPPTTDISGLYFKGSDGSYFTATYEMAVEIIAKAFQNSEWRQQLGIKNKIDDRPKPEDYARLR